MHECADPGMLAAVQQVCLAPACHRAQINAWRVPAPSCAAHLPTTLPCLSTRNLEKFLGERQRGSVSSARGAGKPASAQGQQAGGQQARALHTT